MKAVEPASSEGPEIVMNHATFRKRWQLASFLDGCARAGMERVSIWGDTVADTGLAQSRVLLGDAGLTVFGWNRAGPLLASEASERAALLEAARGQVRLAADFGADHVMVFTGGPPRGAKGLAGGRAEAQDAIAALLEVAQDAGIDLALEPLHPMLAGDRTVLCTLGEANDLCDLLWRDLRQDSVPDLGIVVDTHHVWWDPDLRRELLRASGRIRGFHVNDWLVPLPHPLNGRGMMGDGIIDLAGMWADVKAAGYRGPIEVEIFSERWWAEPPEAVLALALARCSEIFGRLA